jgi:hypothetical protein
MVLLSLLTYTCLGTTLRSVDHVRHATITFQQCGSKEKTTHDIVITERKPSAADAKQFTRFLVASKDVAKVSVTIKKDAHGWPISLQMSGSGAEADPLTSMLFILRQPLWSSKPGEKQWQATIGSPFEPGQKIKVSCHVSHPTGEKGVLLEQKTELIPIGPGMKALFTSSSVYESAGGKAKTVKVNVGVNTSSKDGQLIFYEEKD